MTSPVLAKGQIWKMNDVHIQIVDLGKRLIDYRMFRRLGERQRTQTMAIVTLENYLKTHRARLIKSDLA